MSQGGLFGGGWAAAADPKARERTLGRQPNSADLPLIPGGDRHGGGRPPGAEAEVPEIAADADGTRWVICPATITGSMDAMSVDPNNWRVAAKEMAAARRGSVDLYSVETEGGWTKRGRMNPDGSEA